MKQPWPNLRFYPGLGLKGPMETTKNISQGSQSPDRYMNPGPPIHKARVLTNRPLCSVINQLNCVNQESNYVNESLTLLS